MEKKAISSREYREHMLSDPHRPTYHFAIPDDNGVPGDPNGAFFADGLYHLMYLYRNSKTGGFHWGHQTSKDLIHWRQRPDALTVSDDNEGCFSGGAFVDDDGTAYLTFWKFPERDPSKGRGGIAFAYSNPPYDEWERIEPIAVESTEWGIADTELNGETVHLGCADPSNIWKKDGYYYMQLGNLLVLNKYGRDEDSPEKYQGGWTELFRSKDLRNWEFLHRFYDNTFTGDNDWPDRTEDDMCPSFLPLYDAKSNGKQTDKWLQLFISHNKGCQYFVGTLNNEKFCPEVHGRMTWKDFTYFAPEALIDDRNRHIIWTWLQDNREKEFERFGWSGVYSFPRIVWWEKNSLHIAPAQELDLLQYNHQKLDASDKTLPVKNGNSFRLKATCGILSDEKTGFRVKESSSGNEYTEIYVDPEAKTLVMNTSKSGAEGRMIKEEAPFEISRGEKVEFDIFVDNSVVEVYVNERQAICRRVYPTDTKDAVGVSVIGDPTAIESVDVWEMAPANMY